MHVRLAFKRERVLHGFVDCVEHHPERGLLVDDLAMRCRIMEQRELERVNEVVELLPAEDGVFILPLPPIFTILKRLVFRDHVVGAGWPVVEVVLDLSLERPNDAYRHGSSLPCPATTRLAYA